jgi:hypothetical protein
MNRKFTLILAAAFIISGRLFSQSATEDSLAGFDPSAVLSRHADHHDPAEEAQQMKLAQRDYIDKKYHLGKYSSGYEYPGTIFNNAVFPVAACTNVDFENGDFTGWAGAIGDNTVTNAGPLQAIQNGFYTTGNDAPVSDANARHTIMTPAFGNDPYGGFPVVPAGAGNYTVRMGGETPLYQGEYMEQTFTVSPTSTSFAYRYAVVLNDPPTGHLPTAKPYFKIEVLDQNGNPISNCTQYFVVSDPNNPGFFLSSSLAPNGDPVYYRPWTLVNFDLSLYVNQNITVRFTVAGCTQSGHFGYAYFDCSCSALAATVNFCPGNTFLFLTAPDGYAGYQWLDPNHNYIPGATNDTLFVNNPNVGDTFFVYLTSISDTSCHNILPVVLQYTQIYANALSTDESCYGYSDGTLSASGTLGVPPYTFTWNTNPQQTGTTISNVPAGTYIVHMVDSFGCESYDTAIVAPGDRFDTSLFVYTFCPGDPHITLIAPPGYQNYTWIGPNGDTLTGINPPNTLYLNGPQVNDEYTVILHSPPACPIEDSIILNLTPPVEYFKPDSTVNVFTPNGDLRNDYFYPYFDYSVSQQTAMGPGTPQYDFFDLYIATFEIWIYNRWGELVFYSNDYTIGWDGKFDKKDANEGVYYWVCKYTSRCTETPQPYTSTGFVHLIRGK